MTPCRRVVCGAAARGLPRGALSVTLPSPAVQAVTRAASIEPGLHRETMGRSLRKQLAGGQ